MERLELIASLVDTYDVYDIGCDHGLLSIYLSKNHNVIASDITDASVNKTKKNVDEAKANVKVIKSDGFKELDVNKDGTAIIAGMGTYTILKIVPSPKTPNTLIIQANNNHDILRRKLVKLGYYIDDEKYYYNNRWYVIIKFKKGNRKYSGFEYLFGINPTKDYLLFNYKIYNKMLNDIPHKYLMKRIRIKNILNKITKKMKDM